MLNGEVVGGIKISTTFVFTLFYTGNLKTHVKHSKHQVFCSLKNLGGIKKGKTVYKAFSFAFRG